MEFLAGQSMVLTWTYSGGTINLASDYRNVTWNPSVAYVDTSAGSDTQIARLPALKDATAAIELVNPVGSATIIAALQPKTAGTLIIGPEGTASGKRKITFPAYCDGAQTPYPYADVATITCNFTGSSVLGNFTDATY